MRNQIGIPPLDREVDSGTPLAPGSMPRKAPHHVAHAGMPPEVSSGARHGDAPYVGGFDKPVTERDTNVSLYVGLVIGAIALTVVVMVLVALF